MFYGDIRPGCADWMTWEDLREEARAVDQRVRAEVDKLP